MNLFQKSHHENIEHASSSDKTGYDCDLSIQSIQIEKNNDCEMPNDSNKMENIENKKNDIELKGMAAIIKKQKQIICEQYRRIKNQSVKLRKYYQFLCIARHDLKALKQKGKQDKNRLNYAALLSKIRNIFTDDQIAVLKHKRRVRTWSNESIKKALRLRFSCGITGYEELRRQNIPLPGLRTLRRRLEDFKFQSGISDDIFKFLELKISDWDDIDKECCLVYDEISISSGKNFDNSSQSYIGDVTFPEHTGIASHAMVFMLCGIACRWKQIIGYYFTGDGFNGAILQPIINDILHRAESIGLTVNSITSDMGSGNQALWKAFGITAGKYNRIVSYIPHPCDRNRKLYIIADVPHLLKNLKSCLLNNKFLVLPENIVSKYNLPTNIVQAKHFEEIILAQKEFQFLLTPKLSISDVDTNNNFDKMRVNKAKNLLSHEMSSALEFLADEKPEYITTAFFVKMIVKWYTVMTSRHCSISLGIKDLAKYKDMVSFLTEIIETFSNLRVGIKKNFKPVQKGVIISTTSVIELASYLFRERKFQFLLTGRLTQDCVENLFSVLRSKNVTLNALQFKNNLKLIAISLYMRLVSRGNYEEDDAQYITGFLDVITEHKSEFCNQSNVDLSCVRAAQEVQELNNIESNILYSIAGYIVTSIKKNTQLCECCIQSLGSTRRKLLRYAKLVRLRSYKNNTLFFVNDETFEVFKKLEYIFRQYQKSFTCCDNVKKFLVDKFLEILRNSHILKCHNLHLKIANRYAVYRLRICNKKKVVKRISYDSKSMAMHTIIK